MQLERFDVLVALLPNVLGEELLRQALAIEKLRVHAHHQHLLVIGAVEDAEMPAPGQHERRPPQKIVIELERARRLEGMHVATLRVDLAHHVLDHAVLARGVEALEYHEDCPLVLGIEPLLQLGETLGSFGEQRLGLALLDVDPAAVGRIDVGQAEFAAVGNAKTLCDLGRGHGAVIISSRWKTGDPETAFPFRPLRPLLPASCPACGSWQTEKGGMRQGTLSPLGKTPRAINLSLYRRISFIAPAA